MDGTSDVEKERAWQDVMTRAGAAAKFYNTEIRVLLRSAYEYAGGDLSSLKKFKRKRLGNPLSFSGEICSSCRTLETSFTANDEYYREVTVPWYEQYVRLFEGLVEDSYRTMGMGMSLTDEVDLIRGDLTSVDQERAIKTWDGIIEHSRNFLYWGRNCFADSEKFFNQQFSNIQRSRLNNLEILVRSKYLENNERTLKSIGGLFAINRELLCEDCLALVEESPITWRG